MQEISLHIQDIAQNSISADASAILVRIAENTAGDTLEVAVVDDGRGMSEEQIKKVTDPFYTTRTTRKVGLGIPLFKMAAEMTGGRLDIASEVGKGTSVRAVFTRSHIDRMPLGDVASTVSQLICLNEDIDITFEYDLDGALFSVSTGELKKELDGLPLSSPQVVQFVCEYVRENVTAVSNGDTV